MMKTTVEILNLKCGGCANTIIKGILTVKGLSEVNVNLDTSEVSFNSEDPIVINSVKEKLSKMGYPELGDANTIIHKAKSFVSCATGRMSKKE